MAWFTSRVGRTPDRNRPKAKAIQDMLVPSSRRDALPRRRRVAARAVSRDRVDRLRARTAIGATARQGLAAHSGRKSEDADDYSWCGEDRSAAAVHLAPSNIRDVVHRRLLQKTPDAEVQLRELFEQNRPDLKLFAYKCESVTPSEFVEVYPLVPGQIDLILQITSALRTRSARAQGDDQAIRGLLQLLGELFRDQKLAEKPVGSLVTLDQIYEVQHTALDADVQASMSRVLSQCADGLANCWCVPQDRGTLELIQDTVPDAKLVAQCLYDRVDRGNHVGAVTDALDELRRRSLWEYQKSTATRCNRPPGRSGIRSVATSAWPAR